MHNEWKTAYKLMRQLKDGTVHPLFINKREATQFGVPLKAKCYPTNGFAVRQGWHCCFTPYAPHLKTNLANGERRVWVEVLVRNYSTYNRPESQGGKWILAQEMVAVKILCENEVNQILTNVA